MGEQKPDLIDQNIDRILRAAGSGLRYYMPSTKVELRKVMGEIEAEHRVTIAALVGALEACEEYFDNRSDVKDGDYGIPEPNREMVLLSEVRSALQLARGEKGDV